MEESTKEKSAVNKKDEVGHLLTLDDICNRVYTIRGQRVMLDCDLAEIYGYEVKRLNEQVKRNIARFPEDFMFQISKEEINFVKSQIATSRKGNFFEGQEGGRRKAPYAFTEQGIYMLATVLRGELAEQQSIFIMRAFREMRHYIRENRQFVSQAEMRFASARISEISIQIASISDKQRKTEADLEDIHRSIDALSENFVTEKDIKNFVIYKGQKFEADVAYIDIYRQAQNSIYVIDDYMNVKSLQLLSQKQQGVEVIIFTENGHGRNGFLTNAIIKDFEKQYSPLRIKGNPDCHDRWIILDFGTEAEQVFHCGASSKDAGRKLCAINKVENVQLIHPVIEKLLLGEDKVI